MKVTPTLSVNGNSILASFVDSRGSKRQGFELKARVFGSSNGGKEWSEVDMENNTMQNPTHPFGPEGANLALAATQNNAAGFKVLTISPWALGDVTPQLWNIEL